MNKIFTLLLTLLLTVSVNAAPLSPEQALQRLSGTSVAKRAKGLNPKALKLTLTGHTEDGQPAYYVFAGDSGTFILSGDDIAEPVLGYTDSYTLTKAEMPTTLKWWLQMYADEIQAASAELKLKGGSLSSKAKAPKSAPSRQAIAPMVTTVWDQWEPFNQYCPSIGGEKTVTGCVATAIAQVMNYYQWPQSPVPPISYQWNGQTLTSPTVILDWGNMLDSYNGSYTADQAAAVARLMQVAGYAVSMNYDTPASNGSSASSAAIRNALVEKLGYDVGTEYYFRDYFSYEEWKDMIYDNLLKFGPVIYGGTGDAGGHCFVCDGYDGDDYFHINWGWSGDADGYFLLSALDPTDLGIGGGSGGFNYFQGAVLGLQRPQPGSSTPVPYIACTTSLRGDSSGNYLQLSASDDGGFFNLGSVTGYFNLGACLTNIGSGEATYIIGAEASIEPMAGYTAYWVEIPSSLPYGDYSVRAAFKVDSHDWNLVRYEEGKTNSFTVRVSYYGVEVMEEEPEEITLEAWDCPTGFTSGEPYNGYLTVASTYSRPIVYSLDAYLCVEDGDGLTIVEELGSSTVSIPAHSRTTMEFSGTLGEIEPGYYYLVFAQDYQVVGTTEVEVLPAEEGEVTYVAWDCPTGLISGEAYTGYLTMASSYAKSIDYYLDAYLCVDGEDDTFTIVEYLGTDTVTIPAKSEATLTFSGTLSYLDPGAYYLVFAQESTVIGYKTAEVTEKGTTLIDTRNEEGIIRYYNLDGVEVPMENMEPGLYIRKDGDTTVKILVK